jgi:hypothetical protein
MGVLALIASSAALAVNWDHPLTLGTTVTYGHVGDSLHFYDTGIFTLDVETEVNVSIVDLEVVESPAVLNVKDLTVYLDNSYVDYFGELSDQNLSLGLLSDGDHTLSFHGFIDGSTGAVYNVTVSAVPLPAAAWLMGSALFGFAAFNTRLSV